MTPNRTKIIVAIVASSLFTASAIAADNQDAVTATKAATTAATDKPETSLAKSPNTTAVEDAIEAVLAANKLDLDIRFVGRKSANIADGR